MTLFVAGIMIVVLLTWYITTTIIEKRDKRVSKK